MSIQDVEQTIDRAFDGFYVNYEFRKKQREDTLQMDVFLDWQLTVKNDAKISDGVDGFIDDGSQCQAYDIQTLELGKVGSRAEPAQLRLVWVKL